MASPTVTNTFSNSTTADATQVNQNFTDLINALTDGTKDLSVSALTLAGNLTANGNTTIGNAAADDLTITASLASSIGIKTHNSYDVGTVTSKGLRAIYFASSSATQTAKLQGPAIAADITLTMPTITGNIALSTFTLQQFTSGSGTYTTPAGVKWIRVRMCGAGGGGGGSGTAAGSAAVVGGGSTFGTTLLSAAGGNPGLRGGDPATGGAASLGSGPIGIALTGGYGGSGVASSIQMPGGSGGTNSFGGAGACGGNATGTSSNGLTNTGGGGGGGLGGATAGMQSGGGGAAGGYVDAIIVSPLATYAYTVGASGAAGGAGTSGNAGGNGGSGYIIVEEHY